MLFELELAEDNQPGGQLIKHWEFTGFWIQHVILETQLVGPV